MRAISIETFDTWPPRNTVNPVTRGPAIYYVNSVFFSIATVAVWLRIYTRIFVRKWFGIDDAAILLAWFFAVVDMSSVFYAYKHFYWDRHVWDADPLSFTPGSKLFMVTKSAWSSASCLIRLSIMFSFYRLLNHIGLSRLRWVLHAVTLSIVALYTVQILTTIFACVPVTDYFLYPSPGTCINEGYSLTILSAFNTFSESMVAALPLPIIYSVDMRRSERIAVSGLLCLGFLVSVVGAARTSFVWKVFASQDLTWWAAPHWICSEVELSVAMVCASAPALRPLIGRLFGPKLVVRETTHKRQNSYHKTDSSLSTNNLQPPPAEASGNFTSYSTYWRTIDVEGIGVDDGFGYTVTITSANLKSSRRRGCLRSLIFPPDDDPEFPELALRDSRTFASKGLPPLPEHPAGAAHHHRERGSVPMWGLRGFDKEPIEVIARSSLEVVEESRAGDFPRRSSDALRDPRDASNIMFGVGWSPPPGSPPPGPGEVPEGRRRDVRMQAREKEPGSVSRALGRTRTRTPDEAAAAHESFFCESDPE